jgi:hypothetical protein
VKQLLETAKKVYTVKIKKYVQVRSLIMPNAVKQILPQLTSSAVIIIQAHRCLVHAYFSRK